MQMPECSRSAAEGCLSCLRIKACSPLLENSAIPLSRWLTMSLSRNERSGRIRVGFDQNWVMGDRAHLRRRRLSRAEGRKGRGQDGILDHRDRWTLARRRRIRSFTQALDRRTNLCLAQSFSTLGTRFRAVRQDRCRLHPPRRNAHHAEAARCKPLVTNPNFAMGSNLTPRSQHRFTEPAKSAVQKMKSLSKKCKSNHLLSKKCELTQITKTEIG